MNFKIKPISGDASPRKFYRLILNKTSRIIVFTDKEKYKNIIVYATINKFLKHYNINVPKIFLQDYLKGIMIIQDFGDLNFYKVLIKKKNKLPTYKKLVDLLIKIQKIKPKSKLRTINNKVYFLDKYSTKILHKESDLFFDWYLPLFLKKSKIIKKRIEIKKILSRIYKKLNYSNRYLVHKDYHVHNLMKVGNKIGVIDTQDVLIGNPAYDLVSLIDDVRIKTSQKLKKQILKYYLSRAKKIYLCRSKFFMEDFNILSVQRSLKIIGIFARLYKRDNKNKYLRLIPYTWKLLDFRLKEKNFEKLRLILDKIVPNKIKQKTNFQ